MKSLVTIFWLFTVVISQSLQSNCESSLDWNCLCSSLQQFSNSTATSLSLLINDTIEATSLCRIATSTSSNIINRSVTLRCSGDRRDDDRPHFVCYDASGLEDNGGGCFEFVINPYGSLFSFRTENCIIQVMTDSNGFLRTMIADGNRDTQSGVSGFSVYILRCVFSPPPSYRKMKAILFHVAIKNSSVPSTSVDVALKLEACKFHHMAFESQGIVVVTAANVATANSTKINLWIELLDFIVYNVTWKGGGILSIEPLWNDDMMLTTGHEITKNRRLTFIVSNLVVWDSKRLISAMSSTSGLIAIVGDETVELNDKHTVSQRYHRNSTFSYIHGTVSNVTYFSSSGRLLLIAGGWEADAHTYILENITAIGIASESQNGGVLYLGGRCNVTIGTFIATRTSTTWMGAVLGVVDDASVTIFNITTNGTYAGDHGGALILWDAASLWIRYWNAFNSYSRYAGGVAWIQGNPKCVIENLYVVTSGCGSSGGVAYIVNNSTVVINSLRVENTWSGLTGGTLLIGGTSTTRIDTFQSHGSSTIDRGGAVFLDGQAELQITMDFLVQNCSTLTGGGGVIYLNESSVMRMVEGSSFTARNTYSGGNGGVVSVNGQSTFQAANVTIINSTSIQGGGGVMHCGPGATCRMDDVIAVEGAYSQDGPGGFMLVNNSVASVMCRSGSSSNGGITASTMVSNGGCVYYVNTRSALSPKVTLRGCSFRSCSSTPCSTEEKVVLTIESQLTDTQSYDVQNNTCPVLYLSPPINMTNMSYSASLKSTPCPVAVRRTNPSGGNVEQVDTVVQRFGSVVEVSGTVLAHPEVVMGAQIIQAVWKCRHPGAVGDRHSWLSFGRMNNDRGTIPNVMLREALEVMMIVVGTASVFAVNGLVALGMMTFLLMRQRRRHKSLATGQDDANDSFGRLWIRSVQPCRYPGLSTRYHMTLTLPMVSSCTAVAALGPPNIVSVVCVGTLCSVMIVPICIHVFSTRKYVPIIFLPSQLSQRWFLPRGVWHPKVTNTLGGVFYNSYAPFKNNHVVPHVWVWITTSVGILMTVVATLVEVRHQQGDDDQPPNTEEAEAITTTCNVVSLCCGVVVVLSGCVHVAWMREVMCVRSMSCVRGVRLVSMGAMMCMVGVMGLLDARPGSESTVKLDVLTFVSLSMGFVETLLSVIVAVLPQWLSRKSKGYDEGETRKQLTIPFFKLNLILPDL